MMHAGARITVAGEEMERDTHLRVSWPGEGGRGITLGDLLNIIADDQGWEDLGRLAAECAPASITNREMRRLRAAAGEPELEL